METEFAKRLKLARREAGMTQAELSQKLGISQSTLASLELRAKGTSRVVDLARALGVRPDWLSSGDGPMREINLCGRSSLEEAAGILTKEVGRVPTVLQPSARDALVKWAQGHISDENLAEILTAFTGKAA